MLEYLKKYLVPEKLTKEQNKEFIIEYNRRNFDFAKFSLVLIFLFNLFYYWLDYLAVSQKFYEIWVIRTLGLTLPTVFVFLLFLFLPSFGIRYYQTILFFYILWMSFAIIFMISLCEGAFRCLNLYFIGINVVNSLTIVFKLRIRWAFWIYWLSFLVYGILIVFYYKFSFEDVYAHLLFFISFSTSFTFGTLYIEKYAINAYLNEKTITKQKDELKQKNEEISRQREELLVVNQKLAESKQALEQYIEVVNDSINYASRLQNALFPKLSILENFFSNFSIEFRPREILSGDFYWWKVVGSKLYLAIGDGTGHSISGAFMSILGISLLNDYFEELKKMRLNEFLESYFKHLSEHFSGDVYDSVDIALIKIDVENKKLYFSGYGIPAYLFSTRKFEQLTNVKIHSYEDRFLYELLPLRVPIGFSDRVVKNFFEIEFDLNYVERILIFTDGFTDQINPKGEKLGRVRLRKFVLENYVIDFQLFFDGLMNLFDSWKLNERQLDDVLVFVADIKNT